MRWGITLIAWTLTLVYLANGCLDYVRIWNAPPRGFTREDVLPHLEACAQRKTLQLAGTTVVLVSLYFASGWLLERRRSGSEDA